MPLPTADESTTAPTHTSRARSLSAPPVLARPDAPAPRPGLGSLQAGRFTEAASSTGPDQKVNEALSQLKKEKNIGVLDSAIEHFATANPKNQKAIVNQFIHHIDILGAANAQDLQHLDCLYEALGHLSKKDTELTAKLIHALIEHRIGNPPQDKWGARLFQITNAVQSLASQTVTLNALHNPEQNDAQWKTIKDLQSIGYTKLVQMAAVLDEHEIAPVRNSLMQVKNADCAINQLAYFQLLDENPSLTKDEIRPQVPLFLSLLRDITDTKPACLLVNQALDRINRYDSDSKKRLLQGSELALNVLSSKGDPDGTIAELLTRISAVKDAQ